MKRLNTCPYCHKKLIRKNGTYYVQHLKTYRQRYRCLGCKKSFSHSTNSPTYFQKKSHLNQVVLKLLISGNTQRRCAHLLGCTKNTIQRKFIWLVENLTPPPKLNDRHIQIDEMESIEHTKLKPLTIPLCISEDYQILSIRVGRILAKGHLARISLKKYGVREDEREKSLRDMLTDLKNRLVQPPITITTDSLPMYKSLIKEYFPHSKHIQVISRDKMKKHRELVYEKKERRSLIPSFNSIKGAPC